MGKRGSGDPCAAEDASKWDDVDAHVRAGGGLLVAMCPWGFEQVRGITGASRDEAATLIPLLSPALDPTQTDME